MKTITKLLFLICAVLLVSCSPRQAYLDVSELSDKHIAFLKDDVVEESVKDVYPDANVTKYDKAISLFLDMESNRCDAAIMSSKAADLIVKRNQDYVVLGTTFTTNGDELYVIVPRKYVADEKEAIEDLGFFEKITGSLSRNLFNEKAMHLIWGGFKTTVIIFFFGAIFAMILGALLAYLSISHKCLWLYKPLSWFVMTIHDVPSVVLMMFFFYVVFGGTLNGIVVSIIPQDQSRFPHSCPGGRTPEAVW